MIIYIFFSGGFDSTFLLKYYSIIKPNYKIIPIYILNNNLDGYLIDYSNIKPKLLFNNDMILNNNLKKNIRMGGRRNKQEEINRANNIINNINNNNISKLQILNNIKLDNHIIQNMKILNRYFHRSIRQYTFIAQVLKDNKHIQIADIGSEFNNNLDNTVLSKAVYDFFHYNMTKNEYNAFNNLFGKLYFYLIRNKITKINMINISKKYNFYNLLEISISCWYLKKNGDTCKQCYPCKNRIIPYKIIII